MEMYFFWCLSVIIIYNVSCESPWNNKEEFEYGPNLIHTDLKKNHLNTFEALDQDTTPHYCRRRAICQPLNYTTCFGIRLPYTHTSLSLVKGFSNQEEVQEKLAKWKGLINLPKCWAVIQPYLCALYMPKCKHDLVDLPSMEMCNMIQGPCRILGIDKLWPPEFVCDNSTFQYKCKNDARELKFNTTGHCKFPLVQAEQESSYYDGMEGCGIQCHDPLFTDEERQEIRSIVIVGSILDFLFSLFTVLTFAIDWKHSNKFPGLAIFYANLCFLMASIWYLYQFIRPGSGDNIVCHKDGTLRTSEPSIRENLSCVASFVFTYYFLIAGIVWLVIFAYHWHLSSQAVGKINERKDKKGSYYHLVAWSLSFVLMITIITLGEVDGDSLTGICFVGVINKLMRAIFLLVPLLVGELVGHYFFLKGLITLIHLKMTSKEVISKHASAKIRENIVRVSIFSIFSLLFGVITFVCHIYDFQNHQLWKDSFRRLLVCKLGVVGDTETGSCKMAHRPSVLMVQLQLLAMFGTPIIMSSWVWTNTTAQAWRRFYLSKVMNKEVEEPVMLKKHKVIARAYRKKDLLNRDGRLSISIYNSFQDPVGLNFELNSLASNNLSTTWAKALPKLITRRGALVIVPRSNSSYRRNSADSEISYSVRRVSLESRRHSLDSTVSVQAVEVTKTVLKRPHNRHRRSHNDHKQQRQRSPSPPRYSSSSEGSNLEQEVRTALNIKIQESSGVPNMNRRSAISGIEFNNLHQLADKLFSVANETYSSSDSDTKLEKHDATTDLLNTEALFELSTNSENDNSSGNEQEGEIEHMLPMFQV